MSNAIIPLISAAVAGAVGYNMGRHSRDGDTQSTEQPTPTDPPEGSVVLPPLATPDQEPWLDSVYFEVADEVETPPDTEDLILVTVEYNSDTTAETWWVRYLPDGRILLSGDVLRKTFVSSGELPDKLVSGLRMLRDTIDGRDGVGYCVLNSTHDVILLCCKFADGIPRWQRAVAFHVPTARDIAGAVARVVFERI